MLVRSLEIEIRRPFQLAVFQREGVRCPAIEPHVENVVDLLVPAGVVSVAEESRGFSAEPGIRPALLYRLDDAAVYCRIVQGDADLAVDKQRQRHAPGPLARDK